MRHSETAGVVLAIAGSAASSETKVISVILASAETATPGTPAVAGMHVAAGTLTGEKTH